MNEIPNPETSKKRGWSIVRKAQVAGAIVGAFLTVGLTILGPIGGSVNFWGFIVLLEWISSPVIIFCKIFSLKLVLYNNQGGFSMQTIYLLTVANTFSFFVIGTFVGWILKIIKHIRR